MLICCNDCRETAADVEDAARETCWCDFADDEAPADELNRPYAAGDFLDEVASLGAWR